MVSFLDSDVGFIEALTPDDNSWEGLLNREMAKSYEIPLEHFPIEPAVVSALAWSAAVGLTPDEEAIRQILLSDAPACWGTLTGFWTAVADWCARTSLSLEPVEPLLTIQSEQLKVLLWTGNRTLSTGEQLGLAQDAPLRESQRSVHAQLRPHRGGTA